jgi:hypothetical protein
LFYTLKVVFIKDSAQGYSETDYAEDVFIKGIKILTNDTVAASKEE